jgi:hypothetical protein
MGVMALVLLALALATGAPPAFAQTFSPTAEEKRLCELEKARNAAENAESEYMRRMQRGEASGNEDWVRISNAAGRARKAWEDYYFAIGYNVIEYSRKEQYNAWCLGVGTSDFTDKMGVKADVPVVGQTYRISISMPKVGDYRAAQAEVYVGASEHFRFNNARITGQATWRTWAYENPSRGHEIRAKFFIDDRLASSVVGTTDNSGRFTLVLPIQTKGLVFERTLQKDIIRGLTGSKLFPSDEAVVPGEVKTPGSGTKAQEPLLEAHDYTHLSVNTMTKIHAAWKDAQMKKLGVTSTNHLEQWKKNHAEGRDDINAMNSMIDLITSPATTTAQLFDTVGKMYKQLTGEPLPGTREMSPDDKARFKAFKQQIWDRIKLQKKAAEGRLFNK